MKSILFHLTKAIGCSDIGVTSHIYEFQKILFEEMNNIENVIVYFAYISSLKPMGVGSIRLKVPSFPDFVLINVLYLLELHRSLLSLVQI